MTCEYSFVSDDEFEVAGLGKAFAVKNPHECSNFRHLLGQIVEIDGKQHTVRDVERFAHAPPWRKDEPIALFV